MEGIQDKYQELLEVLTDRTGVFETILSQLDAKLFKGGSSDTSWMNIFTQSRDVAAISYTRAIEDYGTSWVAETQCYIKYINEMSAELLTLEHLIIENQGLKAKEKECEKTKNDYLNQEEVLIIREKEFIVAKQKYIEETRKINSLLHTMEHSENESKTLQGEVQNRLLKEIEEEKKEIAEGRRILEEDKSNLKEKENQVQTLVINNQKQRKTIKTWLKNERMEIRKKLTIDSDRLHRLKNDQLVHVRAELQNIMKEKELIKNEENKLKMEYDRFIREKREHKIRLMEVEKKKLFKLRPEYTCWTEYLTDNWEYHRYMRWIFLFLLAIIVSIWFFGLYSLYSLF